MSPVLSVQVLPRRGVLLRAVLAALEVMTFMVAVHTWAGGSLPAPAWVAAAAGLVLVTGLVVLRGGAPLRVMVPALVGAQLLLHCWMAVLTPEAATSHQHGPHLDLTWQMLLAHAAGGVVTAVVWALRRRAVEVLVSWSDAGIVPVPAVRRAVARYAPVRPLRRPLVVVPLRGPPVGLGIA
jgi:hypothetical protein